ncbi:unnamed protein product [Symbiodinium sp. KB8]|nr:unnamed protein product [Symbiodinium sp. KB8]
MEPGAYEASAKAAAEDEQAFENIAGAKEKEGLVATDENKDFVPKYNLAEDDLLESMCRMDPMSAMLHYFLAAGVDEEQLGDLFLERMPSPIRPAEDEPVPIYTSRTKYSALVLNLGSFARNRKKTAGEINAQELDFLHWETVRNPNGENFWSDATNKATHMNVDIAFRKVASEQVSLPHECLASMFMDCLHYQVDLIAGDPNMGLYRYSGTRQESMDIKGGMYQSVLTYFLEAWANSPRCMPFCIPKAHQVSANSRCLLKQYEDTPGQPYGSTGVLFRVCIRWSPPFWSGAIRQRSVGYASFRPAGVQAQHF